jgi:FKBP-type peptidyl-prolyl cis-trans isomerase
MRKGERATLICSPDFAYGDRGSPPKIPPKSTLNFEVELLDFKDKKKEKW